MSQSQIRPITQQEYYGLQAVFAALDRTDRQYYRDDALLAQLRAIEARQRELNDARSNVAAENQSPGWRAPGSTR